MAKIARTAEADMSIFLLDCAKTPWGDWSDVLEYGLVDWDEETDARSIERSGPYTPVAYLCWDALILTQPIKELFENSGLKGTGSLVHLEKTHIVDIDWKTWDTTKDITHHLELDGEPSDIITSLPHDEWLAKRMPEYWLVSVDATLSVQIDRTAQSKDPSNRLQIIQADPSIDFFHGHEHTGYFVSQRAKDWLEYHCPGCFTFSLIPFVTGADTSAH